jgi:hypothetical protein
MDVLHKVLRVFDQTSHEFPNLMFLKRNIVQSNTVVEGSLEQGAVILECGTIWQEYDVFIPSDAMPHRS